MKNMGKERHGFVTFILWLEIIVGAFTIIACFSGNSYYLTIYNNNRTILTIVGLSGVINMVALILILNWINGFWLYLGINIIGIIISVVVGYNFFLTLIISILSILIQYSILKIKKNGISTWDYLTNNYTYENTSNNKKCRQCNTVYTGSHKTCPNCGSSLFEETNQRLVNEYKPISMPISGDTWVCKKCNEVNRATSSSCKGCGEYR